MRGKRQDKDLHRVVVVEPVEAPDSQVRSTKAYEIILRAAARVENQAGRLATRQEIDDHE